MARCQFEPVLQWESIRDIIQSVRDGGLLDPYARRKIIQDAACVVGCAVELLTNPPDDSDNDSDAPWPFGELPPESLSDTQLLEALGSVAKQANEGPAQALPVSAVVNILLPILVEVIRRGLKT